MVQAITVLTVLKMLSANAETTCNGGLGRVVYERLPDQQLQGFDEEIVHDTVPPFRVLEKCQELCLRDRTASNIVRTCSSFDFQPGSRIASFTGVVEYEESTCHLTREQSTPEGIGKMIHVPHSVHYNEVCLSSNRIERECANRHYVFERHVRKRLKLPSPLDQKEIIAANRTECEDRCLNEYNFVCRSATFDYVAKICWLSRFTRRSHPDLLEDEPNSDYLESTCLMAERRCDGPIIFVKEENKRLGGPFEVDIYSNISLLECQAQCLKADKYFCRAVEYDDQLKRCIIFEEDSMSQKDDLKMSGSPSHDLYDLVCLDGAKGNDFQQSDGADPATSHLFQEGRRADTAFQRYRNSKLGSEFHSEITGRSLSECLDECLRQVSFQCRSAVYSDKFRVCRLSRFNQRDGQRVIYDSDYDYYENLMVPAASLGVGAAGVFGAPTSSTAYPPIRQDALGGLPYQGHSAIKPVGGGFPNSFTAGNYPGYVGGGSAVQGVPYSSSSDLTGAGYNAYGTTHGLDPPPYGISPAAGYHAPVTSIPGLGYPPPSVSPGYPGASLPPGSVGAAQFGIPSITPYPSPHFGGGAGFHPGPGAGGGVGSSSGIRCDEQDPFKHIGIHKKMRRQFVRKSTIVPSLEACERECMESLDFTCRSFNFKAAPYIAGGSRENCELSDRDARELDMANLNYFDNTPDFDFYERAAYGRNGQQDCLDVSQTCSEDGMEFTLRTPDGFLGRVYTHGYYDRCFYKGNGGQVNVLRISGAQGYPDCGTMRFGDVMTNIVVVQFSEYVQTSKDKRYNLTCLFRAPGEATVTSGYMTANSGSPIPIEYLPAENLLSQRVRMMILYQGRPVNTIAVGDPLTFRIDAQDGYNYASDIFASNVVARDPYTGRSVQLIDRYGCPVDNYVFPALDKSREGDGLEARFNAFKIPESNFLVFEATVKSCRESCTPAYCHTSGPNSRTEKSLGRRRKRAADENNVILKVNDNRRNNASTGEEQIREMITVLDSRYDLPEQQMMEPLIQSVCLTYREYYTIVTLIFVFLGLVMSSLVAVAIYYKKYWVIKSKNAMVSNGGLMTSMTFCSTKPSISDVQMKTPSTSNTLYSTGRSSRNLFSKFTLKSHNLLNNEGNTEETYGTNSSNKIHNNTNQLNVTNIEIDGDGNISSSLPSTSFQDPSEPMYTNSQFFEEETCRSIGSEEFHF